MFLGEGLQIAHTLLLHISELVCVNLLNILIGNIHRQINDFLGVLRLCSGFYLFKVFAKAFDSVTNRLLAFCDLHKLLLKLSRDLSLIAPTSYLFTNCRTDQFTHRAILGLLDVMIPLLLRVIVYGHTNMCHIPLFGGFFENSFHTLIQMYLVFVLGRPDVFPVEDLGVRKGMAHLYGYDEADRAGMREHAERWRPYRSYASRYLWRATD